MQCYFLHGKFGQVVAHVHTASHMMGLLCAAIFCYLGENPTTVRPFYFHSDVYNVIQAYSNNPTSCLLFCYFKLGEQKEQKFGQTKQTCYTEFWIEAIFEYLRSCGEIRLQST